MNATFSNFRSRAFGSPKTAQRRRWIVALALAFLIANFSVARAQGVDDKESKLKAAFVLKFPLYIEWPKEAFASPTNAIVFGVLSHASDPFGKILENVLTGQTIDKRPVQVKQARNVAELLDCHVVFISASERDRLRTVLPRLRAKPILTVGDFDGFVTSGGMIGLKRKQSAMRFDINRQAAEAAGLKISSQLLKLADEVH